MRDRRRWDTDTRGTGIASARQYVGPILDLILAAGEPDWVAEEPDTHLLPHLRRECEADRSPVHFRDAHFVDGIYIVELEWLSSEVTARAIRALAYQLIGAIAESSTNVVERVDGWEVLYEVVTGMVAGQTRWAPHGHAIQIRIGGGAVRSMLDTRN